MRKILRGAGGSIHVTVTAVLIRNAISCWLLQPSYWCVCKLNFLMGVGAEGKSHLYSLVQFSFRHLPGSQNVCSMG